MEREIDQVMDPGEHIEWEGTPSFWPFVVGRSLGLALFGGFFFLFSMGFSSIWIFGGSGPSRFLVLVLPHIWIGLAFMVGPAVYNVLACRRTQYVITDLRVILQRGVIGRDFEFVDLDQITNAEVNVGIADRIFGSDTGSVMLSTAGSIGWGTNGAVTKPYTLGNIIDAYGTFRMLKRGSLDVRSDIEFPNAMRPAENPGYTTKR